MTELRDVSAELARFRTRVFVAALVVVFAFSLIAARLVYLQVLRYDDLQAQAEVNRTAVLPITPQRGLIVDRNGVELAANYLAYTLEIKPSEVDDLKATLDALSEIVTITPGDRRRFARLREDSKRFDSLPIRTQLTDEEVARIATQRYRLPGVEVQARLFRNYPLGETGSHVLGYIGRINEREKTAMEAWSEAEQANYRGTQQIGKLGVEQSYEPALHGRTGFERIETTAGGYAVRRLSQTPAQSGDTVVLSIDIKLQKLVESLYGDRRGALVALDPNTGEVLALVSKPTFDPNLFVDGIDVASWRALNESIDRPLFNRALRGTYPPGSTYKPFMGLAALEYGLRKPTDLTNDPGYWMLGEHRFRSPGGHMLGPVDLYRSIVKSSNVYYYQLANDMGVDRIHDFMQPLGFGQLTGIDLRGELRGILPSRAWKQQNYKKPEQQRWQVGDTISLGIGQGYNNFTMLQLAQAMATLANGGVQFTPHVAKATQNPATRVRTPITQPEPRDLGYQPENVQAIVAAMEGVATEGTSARVFAGAPYRSGGKTGTAQAVTIGQKDRYDANKLRERQRDHSLYVGFAPVERPQIAVAAIVENAGYGSTSAAPIVRRVFDYFLLGQYPSEEDIAATRLGQSSAPIGTPRVAADVPLLPNAEAACAAGDEARCAAQTSE